MAAATPGFLEIMFYSSQLLVLMTVLCSLPSSQVRHPCPMLILYALRRIGEGTFGVVSKGIWNQTPVAVKRFKDHVIEEGITSVIREITCLR